MLIQRIFWIYKITINKSLDYLRFKKRKKRKFLFNNLSIERASNNDLINFNHPGVQLESKEKINEIYKCINKLPDSYKTVIILLKIENRTYKEVSSIMGLSVKAIESLFNRAKNTLELYFLLWYFFKCILGVPRPRNTLSKQGECRPGQKFD